MFSVPAYGFQKRKRSLFDVKKGEGGLVDFLCFIIFALRLDGQVGLAINS